MCPKCVLVPLFALVLLAAMPQDDELALSRLEVDLWPEYDRPEVLVIYRATIAPGVELPATVRFRIPEAAGPPNAVAELQADGRLVLLEHDRTADGEGAIVEFVATRPRVQIEYYDPRLERQDDVRRFAFEWPGDYQVGVFVVAAQQPDLARGLTTEPASTREELGNDGLVYKTVQRDGVAAGETFVVELSYEKVAETLTVETLTPEVESPAPTTSDEAAGGLDTALALLAVALLVAGTLVFAAARRRTGERSRDIAGPAAARFCTRCGGPLETGDKFCSQCGTAAR